MNPSAHTSSLPDQRALPPAAFRVPDAVVPSGEQISVPGDWVPSAIFAALSRECQFLREELVDVRNKQREMSLVHREELAAVQQGMDGAERTVWDVRREMVDTAQRAVAQLAAEKEAQVEEARFAARYATLSRDVSVEHAKQETQTAREAVGTLLQERVKLMQERDWLLQKTRLLETTILREADLRRDAEAQVTSLTQRFEAALREAYLNGQRTTRQ